MKAAALRWRVTVRRVGYAHQGQHWWAKPTLRLGATLTEVLIATLIMSVGIVSVFTLFPISVLRTVQATNRTNAKFVKENASQQVANSPALLTGFTAAGGASPVAGFNNRFQWQALTQYSVGDVVVASIRPGTARPTSFGWFVCTAVTDPNTSNAPGTSDVIEPKWNGAGVTNESEITWQRFTSLGATVSGRYVIDPLGSNIAATDGQTADVVDTFGNKTNQTTGVATPFPPATLPLLRINGSLSTLISAIDNCSGGDSWQQVLQAVPTNVAASSVTFPPSTDLAGIFPAGAALVRPRVVLTSLDGSQTVVRESSGLPAGNVVNWSAAKPLPIRFLPANIGQARIEVFNRRYAWFLTVRNVGAQPEIKCIVTFNRSGNTAEEHAYATNFGNANVDVNNDGVADGIGGNQAVIAWQPGAATGWDPEGTGANAFEPAPLIKAGNWLFDARDASWYRIQSVDATSLSTATPNWAFVTLDQTVRVRTPDDASGPPANAQPIGRCVLMPGIIDVFDF